MVKVKPVKLRKYRHRETKKKTRPQGLEIFPCSPPWHHLRSAVLGSHLAVWKRLQNSLWRTGPQSFWISDGLRKKGEDGAGCQFTTWADVCLFFWEPNYEGKNVFFHLSSWPHVWTVESNACFKPLHVSMFVSCWILTIQFILSNISCSTGSGCFLQSSKHVLLILVGIVDKLGVSDLC